MVKSAFIVSYVACLTATSLASLIVDDQTDAKVCRGAANDEGLPVDEISHYNQLKSMYEGCNYVLQNIEIYGMGSLTGLNLDFFSNITEVNGYVRVHGSLPVGVTELPFRNLRIIRGDQLTPYSDASEKEFSLFIYQIANLKSLGLTQLREISRGNVYIGYNANNCYGETVEWKDLFAEREEQKAVIVSHPSENCPPLAERCHSSCGDLTNDASHCWGPDEKDCQIVNFVNCAEQCDYRCFGNEPKHCCHRQCLAGCSGPRDTECWGCRNFYNNGTCTHQCPQETVYNKTTYNFDRNPDAKVAFGKLCLKQCPPGYYEHQQGCLLYGCPAGYKSNGDNKCVLCAGACPKDCDWTVLKATGSWPTSTFLRSYADKNCTRITGDVNMISGAFLRDDYADIDPIAPDDLKVFEYVEEISGIFVFEPEDKLPEVTSLSIFRNLRKVGGSGATAESFAITSTHLTSLSMSNFQELSNGNGYVKAERLCYDVATTLPGMLALNQNIFRFRNLPDPSVCAQRGMVCSDECYSACVGPEATDCVELCPPAQSCTPKCKNYEFKGECIAECSSQGFYINGTQCLQCHQECSSSCTGSSDTDCIDCRHFKNGNRCVPSCPQPTYADGNMHCQPCNEFCSNDQEFGCKGPSAQIGDGGCDACDLLLLSDSGEEIERCLNASQTCPSGYLTPNQWSTLSPNVQKHLSKEGFKEACLKCDSACAECKSLPNACTKCSDKAYEWKKQNSRYYSFNCIIREECDEKKNFVDKEKKQCIECDSVCHMCTGPTDTECIKCTGFKVYHNGTEGFRCVDECPAHLNYTWYIEETKDRECHDAAPPTSGAVTGSEGTKASVIGGSIAAVIIVAVTAIVVTCVCRQKSKHIAKTKAYELRLAGNGNIEPIEPTNADPDLSQLRLIKESELKKTVIIGSGAFGTVFKGYLIPETEKIKLPVAIKVLIEGTTPTQNVELLDEARVMASVVHPCCIKIIAVCMTAQMMLVTPLMSSGCLLNYVKAHAGQLGSKVLINWCAQIARGMEHLQKCGIVHRDLAARNVLVQNETQVKITDFGLAKLLDVGEDYYQTDSGKMPVKWMALESIQHRIFNHQTDVWSYGVTIWELLTFGQKPYDGVKARDIAILLERGERLHQPTISTIDVYMIMIKCWLLDANTRPTFEDLMKEFTKMARDPGRYLVIDGDQLKRNPTLKMNNTWNLDDMPEDEYPDRELVSADDYLSPSIASNYPQYENEDAMPPPFEKTLHSEQGDGNLHSPLRYTSSPTLLHPPSDDARLMVDTSDYLQPVPSRGGTLERPAADDEEYLQPQAMTSVYIDVLGDEHTNDSSLSEDDLQQPLLGADNSIYLSSKDEELRARPTHLADSNPILSAPEQPIDINGTNPIYMSNNNASPGQKQPSSEYINQDIVNVV